MFLLAGGGGGGGGGKCQGFALYGKGGGEMPGICLIWQNWQFNVKHDRLRGKRAVVLPTGCPHSVWLLVGICKGPAISWGRVAVVINDWCITFDNECMQCAHKRQKIKNNCEAKKKN